MGSMRKSGLSKYKQGRLVGHFVAGTAARTAASLCGVNRKTSALYFLRLREIIAYELDAETADMLGVRSKWTRAILAVSAGAVLRARFRYLAY